MSKIITVDDLIQFCEQNEIFYDINGNNFSAGGLIVKDVDVTSFRVDQNKKVIVNVWYPTYDLRFDPRTRMVVFPAYSEMEQQYDIRNHPNWGK